MDDFSGLTIYLYSDVGNNGGQGRNFCFDSPKVDQMIHVAYCFDRAYQQHFGAAVTSLLLNRGGSGSELVIHVLTDEVDAVFQQKLDRLSDTFRAHIRLYPVPQGELNRLAGLTLNNSAKSYLSPASYYRVLLPHILPAEINRVVYLDSDTIVLSDIQPLFDTDLGQASLGAALDRGSATMAPKRGLERYVNSGVMVLSLDRWRREGLAERCLEFAAQNPEKISYGDQCAINFVCHDAVHVLAPGWNRFVLAGTPPEEVVGAAILHYITPDKPWQAWYENSLATLYWRYLDVSPWSGAVPDQPRSLQQAQRLARLRHAQGRTAESCALYESILAGLVKR